MAPLRAQQEGPRAVRGGADPLRSAWRLGTVSPKTSSARFGALSNSNRAVAAPLAC